MTNHDIIESTPTAADRAAELAADSIANRWTPAADSMRHGGAEFHLTGDDDIAVVTRDGDWYLFGIYPDIDQDQIGHVDVVDNVADLRNVMASFGFTADQFVRTVEICGLICGRDVDGIPCDGTFDDCDHGAAGPYPGRTDSPAATD